MEHEETVIIESSKINPPEEPITKPIHPIAFAIDKLINRISSIRYTAATYIPKTAKWQVEQIKYIAEKLTEESKKLDNDDNSAERILVIKEIL